MRLSRSKDGRTVHESGCPTRGQKVPWLWADDKTLTEIAKTLLDAGIGDEVRPCKVCLFDVDWKYAATEHPDEFGNISSAQSAGQTA